MISESSQNGDPACHLHGGNAQDEISKLRSCKELLRAISNTMDLGTLLDLLGNKILEIGNFDGFVTTAVDFNGQNLVCQSVRYPEEFRHLEAAFSAYKFPLPSPGPHASAFLEQRVVVQDAETGSEEEKLALARWKLRQSLILPIVAADPEAPGEIIKVGTVMVLNQKRPFTPEEKQYLQDLIAVFSVPLSNAQKYAELLHQKAAFESAASEQERFLRLVTEINSLTLPDKIFELISVELMNRFSFDLASVFMANGGLLECRKTISKHPDFAARAAALHEYCVSEPYLLDVLDGGLPHAFIKNIRLVFNDIQQVLHLEIPRKARRALEIMETPRTAVNMPIRYKGKPIGVLLLVSLVEPVNLSEADFKLFELLSSFFGTAISNANTYALADEQRREIERLNMILQDKIDELADQVATDKLTGLFNFRTFEQELLRRLNEYQRNTVRQGLSIVMVDIDHFKKFNDTYGHAAGNVILAGVAHEIANLSRKMDIACRYGGEEFVVILPKCEVDGALIFAERVRRAIEQASFEIENHGRLGVTVSIGVSTFIEGDSHETLFERADQALYRAKHGGRNRVCS